MEAIRDVTRVLGAHKVTVIQAIPAAAADHDFINAASGVL